MAATTVVKQSIATPTHSPLIATMQSSFILENSTNLNNRSSVDTSTPEIVIAYAQRDYHGGDKSSVVHVLSRDR